MAEITEDGVTPRHIFALVLLHAEIVANQAPAATIEGFQRDSLVDAAIDMADRLVDRLAEPRPPEYRELTEGEKRELKTASEARSVLEALQASTSFESVDPALRERITGVVHDFADNEIPF